MKKLWLALAGLPVCPTARSLSPQTPACLWISVGPGPRCCWPWHSILAPAAASLWPFLCILFSWACIWPEEPMTDQPPWHPASALPGHTAILPLSCCNILATRRNCTAKPPPWLPMQRNSSQRRPQQDVEIQGTGKESLLTLISGSSEKIGAVYAGQGTRPSHFPFLPISFNERQVHSERFTTIIYYIKIKL